MCEDITNNFSEVLQLLQNNEEKTIPFTYFDKQIQYDDDGKVILNKKEKPVKKLVPVKENATAKFLIEFLRNMLPNIINHRNMLKLYRNIKGAFLNTLNTVYMDIDFSENLTIGINWEPQETHWTKTQVTVHSGLVKLDEEKVYHPYISNSRLHDQVFVHQALEEMIERTNKRLLIESDNCSGQYKSSHHFFHLQSLSNQLNKIIIHLYGIAQHGKGEVDHVGGVAKVAVRREVSGMIFHI